MSFRGLGFLLGAMGYVLSVPSGAQAAGIEDTVTGTHALGRGAYYARVRDFMAVWQNPANLAIAPDNNLGLNLRVPLFDACFTRAKDPDRTYFDGQEPFPTICNEAGPLPSGSGGFAIKLSDNLGIGGGAFVPAGIGRLKFGNDTVYTKDPVDPDDPRQQLPTTQPGPDVPPTSPGRFNLLSRETLSAFFMAGVGWAPMPALRVGLSAGFGFASIHYRSVTALQPGDVNTEFLNDIQATDGFIPRLTASVGSTPIPGLDLSAVFTFNDDIRARGHVDVTANGFQDAELGNCRSPEAEDGDGLAGPGPRCRVTDVRLEVPYQRFQLMLAVRYGMLRRGKEKSVDPMEDEIFDVEVNAYWEQTSHVDSFDLTLYKPASERPPDAIAPHVNASTAPSGVSASPLPRTASIDHNWRDTYGIRVGGDYNALPGLLAVRAGVAYETQGVPDSYMGLDFWPVEKVVLHLGATVRVGPVDLHVAYAHSFNSDVVTPVGTGEVRQVVALDEDTLPGVGRGWPVNEGKYTSSLDVLALGATYRF